MINAGQRLLNGEALQGSEVLSPVSKILFALVALLAVVALFVAGCNRVSYTHFGDSYEQYGELWYAPFYAEADEVKTYGSMKELKKMVNDCDVAAVCEFTGNRRYGYQAFSSEVVVTKVLKGAKKLKGDKVLILEPLRITNIPSFSQVENENAEFAAALEERFDGSKLGDKFVFMTSPGVGAVVGLTPMKEGEKYLLFLKKKKLPSGLKESAEQDYYFLMNNMYAKTSVSEGEIAFRFTSDGKENYLSVKEASEYAVYLTEDAGSAKNYRNVRARLHSLIGLSLR